MKCTHNSVRRIKRNFWQRFFYNEVYRCGKCGKVIKI